MVKDSTDTKPAATGAVTQLFVALVWLGTTMYTHASDRAENLPGALADAAAALPGVVATTLVAGASIAAVAGRRTRGVAGRLSVGLAAGALLGLAVAAGLRFAYGFGLSTMVLAVAASIVGGALAVLLPRDVLMAGLWGATSVFFVDVVFGGFRPNLVMLLGSGEAADTRFVMGHSLVAGLAAAFCALRLRVAGKRVLWYPVAGALPGMVLLCAEWLTRAGGSAVVEVVPVSRAESPTPVELSDSARLRHALIVLAVGGLIAMLVGTLKTVVSRSRRKRTQAQTQASVDAFHQSLARIGLDAGEQYGFALAGGYAVQAAGFLKRPSEDIDLFTVWERRGDFETATRAIADAYLAAGLRVETERRHDGFTRLTVSDGLHTAKVDLGVDFRANDPVRISIGPVLHPDDVVANKMRALYERARACDFIDIDAVLRSGRYEPSILLQLAQRSDITFDGTVFADALARAQLLPDDDFAKYGLAAEELDNLRHRFARWRTELLDTAGPVR